jgi:hypothetical protein
MLAGNQGCQLLKARLQLLAKAEHDSGAIHGGRLAPGGKCCSRGADGAVDFCFRAKRNMGLNAPGGGIEDVAAAVAGGGFESSANENGN